MFLLVPSGKVLLMFIGSTRWSSSRRAISIGDSDPLGISISIGAPIAIWRALAPTTLAFSKRVSFLGPIISEVNSLELSGPFFRTLFQPLWRRFLFLRLRGRHQVVYSKNRTRSLARRLHRLHFYNKHFAYITFSHAPHNPANSWRLRLWFLLR